MDGRDPDRHWSSLTADPLADEICTCGSRREGFMRDISVGDDGDPHTHMWVHSACEKPTRLYLEKFLERVRFDTETPASAG